MDDETNQHQSDHEELVKQDVRYHDDASFHDSKRRLFYRIDSRWNYPLSEGTRPIVEPSRKAFNPAVGLGPIAYLGRQARQLAALAAHDASDERGQGGQVMGHAAPGLARITLFQGLTYGTITPKVVTHRIHLLINWMF
jgi:hypothetical protein